jgi:hypothetical protein
MFIGVTEQLSDGNFISFITISLNASSENFGILISLKFALGISKEITDSYASLKLSFKSIDIKSISLKLGVLTTMLEIHGVFKELIEYDINGSSTSANVTRLTDQLPANFIITSVTLQEGSGSVINLTTDDYNLSGSNLFTMPTAVGEQVFVPANSTTVITINGYFS